MANIYKNEKKSLTNTDLTTLYTVPGNSRAIVKSILAAEDAAGSAVVKVTSHLGVITGVLLPLIVSYLTEASVSINGIIYPPC